MLKINRTQENGSVILRAEGRVVGDWVSELRRCCETALSEGSALKVDLRDVDYTDARGLALLAELKTLGAVLVNCSPFVAEQLRTRSLSKGA